MRVQFAPQAPISASLFLTLSILGAIPTTTHAQRGNQTGYVALETSRVLEELAAGTVSAGLVVAAFEMDRPESWGTVRGNRDQYSDVERRQILDRVEQVARGEIEGDEADVSRARIAAFTILGGLGIALWDTVPESREVPLRLLRIYREADNRSSRALAMATLGRLLAHNPPESSQIVDVIVEVASAEPGSENLPSPFQAVQALLSACEAGVPALERLDREKLIRADPLTAIDLGQLLANGVSEEEMERARMMPCP